MVRLIYLNIIFICFCAQQNFAQKDSLNPYMVSYAEKVIVSASFQSDTDSFVLNQEIDGSKRNLEFYPNIKNKITFGLTYKMIDISFGYTPWFLKSNADKYKASNMNFATRFNHKKWYQSVEFVKQMGFFTEFLDDKSLYLPSFRSIKVGGTTSYVFNEKFSYSALFNQNQWQIKSAGSFVPNFSFFYTSLLNKDEIAEFEVETGLKVFCEIPPLNDKKDNSSSLLPLLEKLGYVKETSAEEKSNKSKSIFNLFK